MAPSIHLTLDCAHPSKLAEFWKFALDYEDEPPPAPFKTRDEWLATFDLSDDDVTAGATIVRPYDGHHIVLADPEGNEFCIR